MSETTLTFPLKCLVRCSTQTDAFFLVGSLINLNLQIEPQLENEGWFRNYIIFTMGEKSTLKSKFVNISFNDGNILFLWFCSSDSFIQFIWIMFFSRYLCPNFPKFCPNLNYRNFRNINNIVFREGIIEIQITISFFGYGPENRIHPLSHPLAIISYDISKVPSHSSDIYKFYNKERKS